MSDKNHTVLLGYVTPESLLAWMTHKADSPLTKKRSEPIIDSTDNPAGCD